MTKLSAAGNALVYSTYLGGSGEDSGHEFALDGSGCVYVTGDTWSPNFPTQNAYDATFNGGNYDAFVSKFSSSGNSLIYSTFLGGSDVEDGSGIVIDGLGCAYVTGYTGSSDFPTQDALDSSHNGSWDAFVSKLSPMGNVLLYSTFLGGLQDDHGHGIALDDSGSIYVTGFTESSDFPVHNAFDATINDSSDVFLTKLAASGDSLVYSTFVGGSSKDVYWIGGSIEVDDSGCAYLTGGTRSPDFPTQDAYDASYSDSTDVFLIKFSATGESLIYSTFIGESGEEVGLDLALDSLHFAYVIGYTYSPGFPVQNAFDPTYNGSGDIFVAKLGPVVSCCLLRGDIDHNGTGPDIADLVYLVTYMFGSGPNPVCEDPAGSGYYSEADIDGSGTGPDIADLVALVNYMFGGCPACLVPCP